MFEKESMKHKHVFQIKKISTISVITLIIDKCQRQIFYSTYTENYTIFNGGMDECQNVKIAELKLPRLGKHGRWLVARTKKERKQS